MTHIRYCNAPDPVACRCIIPMSLQRNLDECIGTIPARAHCKMSLTRPSLPNISVRYYTLKTKLCVREEQKAKAGTRGAKLAICV